MTVEQLRLLIDSALKTHIHDPERLQDFAGCHLKDVQIVEDTALEEATIVEIAAELRHRGLPTLLFCTQDDLNVFFCKGFNAEGIKFHAERIIAKLNEE